MAEEKKGITVKIDADLHAEVKAYVESQGLTMAEFVSKALDDELHPKMNMNGGTTTEKMRTMAFQVPEDLFQKIKERLTDISVTNDHGIGFGRIGFPHRIPAFTKTRLIPPEYTRFTTSFQTIFKD